MNKSSQGKWLKRFGIAFGALITLLLGLILVLPFVINVDRYRPQIVEAANQQINGSVELGKLSLSLWGQVRIEIGGLKVRDTKGQEILGVNDAYFHLPFLPLLSGSPILTFNMNQPSVNVIKTKDGKLNVMSLMKPSTASTEKSLSPGQSPASPANKAGNSRTTQASSLQALPAIATQAKLGLEIHNAQIHYKDEKTALTSDIHDLNLRIKDISLSHPTQMEFWADLNTKLGKTFAVAGPVRMNATAQPTLNNQQLESILLTAHMDLDPLKISAPGLFEKKEGVPAHADLKLVGSAKEAKIEEFNAQFFNAELKAQGVIGSPMAEAPTQPSVNLKISTNDIPFAPWVQLVPLLKEYELGGSAKLEATVNGTASDPTYQGRLSLANFTAKAPTLKAQPKLNASVSFAQDRIDPIAMTLTAPGTDLKVQGKILSFSKPQVDFQITSNGINLDQLMDFATAEKAKGASKEAEKEAPGKEVATSRGSPTKADYDALLAPLRENATLRNAVGNVTAQIRSIQAAEIKLSDVVCKLSLKDLAFGAERCGFKIFGGQVQSNARFELKPRTPVYQFSTQVSGLNLQQAIASQMAMFKNTMTGTASMNLSAQGASFNPDPAMQNLKAKGGFKVQQATFVTIDVMKMVQESLNKSLSQMSEKVPSLKGKTIPSLPSHGSKYEVISSDFSIGDLKFSAPNFLAKAAPNQGLDIKGNTAVGMKDYSLKADWIVTDTYNMTHLKDISVNQSGVEVPHIFAQGNAPIEIPIGVGCTLSAPCYSSTQIPEHFLKIALNNIGTAMTGKAKSEVHKQAEALIKKVAPPSIQNQLQNKLKGLFN